MKCVICHSDAIRVGDVQETVRSGNDIVYVPITTPVCQNCGERYYDRNTMRYLEKVRENLQSKKNALKEIGKVLLYQE